MTMRLPWQPTAKVPEPGTLRPKLVVLASEGRPISTPAAQLAARLARQGGGHVKVLTIARIWGSALGLPHPGLRPTKAEWQAQRDFVEAAIKQLEGDGANATGEVLGSRNAAKAIVRHASAVGAGAIVMTADTEPHWIRRGLLWSHLPHIVARSTPIPVYLTS